MELNSGSTETLTKPGLLSTPRGAAPTAVVPQSSHIGPPASDEEAYKADRFVYGHVPEVPPPEALR